MFPGSKFECNPICIILWLKLDAILVFKLESQYLFHFLFSLNSPDNSSLSSSLEVSVKDNFPFWTYLQMTVTWTSGYDISEAFPFVEWGIKWATTTRSPAGTLTFSRTAVCGMTLICYLNYFFSLLRYFRCFLNTGNLIK